MHSSHIVPSVTSEIILSYDNMPHDEQNMVESEAGWTVENLCVTFDSLLMTGSLTDNINS